MKRYKTTDIFVEHTIKHFSVSDSNKSEVQTAFLRLGVQFPNFRVKRLLSLITVASLLHNSWWDFWNFYWACKLNFGFRGGQFVTLFLEVNKKRYNIKCSSFWWVPTLALLLLLFIYNGRHFISNMVYGVPKILWKW